MVSTKITQVQVVLKLLLLNSKLNSFLYPDLENKKISCSQSPETSFDLMVTGDWPIIAAVTTPEYSFAVTSNMTRLFCNSGFSNKQSVTIEILPYFPVFCCH